MKKVIIAVSIFSLLSLLFTSCSKEDDNIVNATSRFTGSYQFRFTYGFSGSGIMNVDYNGDFEFPVNINASGNSFSASIKGSVKNSGILDGKIYKDTTAQGDIHGQLYITGESGGSYVGNGSVAYWIANYIY